jgi:hypothetical protein
MSASYLDLLGGRRARPPATGLLALGLATALPTIATGIAEWHATSGTGGGYLGGHLSLVHKVGTADPHLRRSAA